MHPLHTQEQGSRPQFVDQQIQQQQMAGGNLPQQAHGQQQINAEQHQAHQMVPSMQMVHPQHPQQITQGQEAPPQMPMHQQLVSQGVPPQHFIPQSVAQGMMPPHQMNPTTSFDVPQNSRPHVPEVPCQPKTPEQRRQSTSPVPTSKYEDQPATPTEEKYTPEDLNPVQPQTPTSVPREQENQTDSELEKEVNSASANFPVPSFQPSTPHSTVFATTCFAVTTFSVPAPEASYTQATGFHSHPTVMPARPQHEPQMMLQHAPMQPVSMQHAPMQPASMQAGPSMPMALPPPRLMMAPGGRPPAGPRMIGPPQPGMVGGTPQAVPVPGQPPFHGQMQFLPPSSGGMLGPRFPGPSMAVQPPQGSVQLPMSMSATGQPVNIAMPQVQVAVVPAPVSLEKKVAVPWGWKRLLLAETVVYFSPSGIQLKSIEEVQEYLSTEGTCKCGLQCPLALQTSFDFNPKVSSEVQMPATQPGAPAQCKHQGSTLALAQIQNNTGFAIRHYHNPTFNRARDGLKRKVKKKKKPFSGVLVSQMLAAREAEKQRINEVGLIILKNDLK